MRAILDDKKRTDVYLRIILDVRNSVGHSRPLFASERLLLAGAAAHNCATSSGGRPAAIHNLASVWPRDSAVCDQSSSNRSAAETARTKNKRTTVGRAHAKRGKGKRGK